MPAHSVSLLRKMKKRYLIVGILIGFLVGLVLFLGFFFGLRSAPQPPAQDGHLYKKAAVATDAGPCSIIGRYLSLLMSVHSLSYCNKVKDPNSSICFRSGTALLALCLWHALVLCNLSLRSGYQNVGVLQCLVCSPCLGNMVAGNLSYVQWVQKDGNCIND